MDLSPTLKNSLHTERMMPGTEKWRVGHAEHLVRYQRAAAEARGRSVLDVACGVGYGSHHLAQAGAARVLGVDRSVEAIACARDHFAHPNVEFRESTVEALPLDGPRYDIVTAFEIVEHLAKPVDLLLAARRLLAPDGALFISTPNGRLRPKNPDGSPRNPFHTVEFTLNEFSDLLSAHFDAVEVLGQRLSPGYLRLSSALRELQAQAEQRDRELWTNPLVRLGRWLQRRRGHRLEFSPSRNPFPAALEDYVFDAADSDLAPYFFAICRSPKA